jgi:hypothetical protein
MRRFLVIFGSVLVIIFCGVPVANADFFGIPNASLGARNLGAGFYMDFSMREFSIKDYKENPITDDPKFEDDELLKFETFRIAFKVGYGIMDSLDVYGKIGSANIDNNDLQVEGEADLLYGGGFKFTLYKNEERRFLIGFGGQYTSFKSTLDDLTQDGRFDAEINLEEIEGFIGINYRGVKNFDIYAGGFYSQGSGDFITENIDQRIRLEGNLEQDIPYGGYLGADLRSEIFRAGAEIRLGSEISFALQFNYTFRIMGAEEEEQEEAAEETE